jgi:signal transduction histidine kinase
VLVKLRPILVDLVLAAVFTALTVVTVSSRLGDRLDWFGYVLAGLTAAPVALRQWAPVTTMAVILGALTAFGLLYYADFPNAGVGMLIAMFTVATLRPRPVAAVLATSATGVIVLVYLINPTAVVWSEVIQAVLVVLGTWALGESTRHWGQRTERLAEEATQAVANERVRIARELHDIVAHHMSVISLQSGLAKYVIDTDLPTARTSLATVEETSREALSELRRLLGVLRVDHTADSDTDLRPQPGLATLDELVDRTRGAGLPVELVVTGEPRPLPAGPDLCAYRIAQESLTNVLKHAGPASARIDLSYGTEVVALTVTDDGSGVPATPSPGHGIRGMRERAELYGGVLTAGALPAGGFRVSVRLPMGTTS